MGYHDKKGVISKRQKARLLQLGYNVADDTRIMDMLQMFRSRGFYIKTESCAWKFYYHFICPNNIKYKSRKDYGSYYSSLRGLIDDVLAILENK